MSETTPAVEQPAPEASGIEHLDERTQAEIRKLRSEAADRRTTAKALQEELEKLKAAQAAEQAKKLEEDGKLKELLDLREKELSEIKLKAEKVDQYEGLLHKQLEAGMQGMTEEDKAFINDLDLPLVKKIEMAAKLKGQAVTSTDSPASSRPGGVSETASKVFDKIDAEKDRKKRAQLLMDLQTQSSELYKKYIGA